MEKLHLRNIKKGFATNSSSYHSTMIINGNISDDSFQINDDKSIDVTLGEYGWGVETLKTKNEKLQYLLTMVVETEFPYFCNKDDDPIKIFKDCVGYKSINEFLNSNGYHLYIPSNLFCIKKSLYDENCYIEKDGYIDHQSCEYDDLNDFLNKNSTSIEEILLNPTVVILIDHDNH